MLVDDRQELQSLELQAEDHGLLPLIFLLRECLRSVSNMESRILRKEARPASLKAAACMYSARSLPAVPDQIILLQTCHRTSFTCFINNLSSLHGPQALLYGGYVREHTIEYKLQRLSNAAHTTACGADQTRERCRQRAFHASAAKAVASNC